MTSRRNKLLLKMLGTTTGETEEKLLKLSIERIVADEAEYYKKFYKNEGVNDSEYNFLNIPNKNMNPYRVERTIPRAGKGRLWPRPAI